MARGELGDDRSGQIEEQLGAKFRMIYCNSRTVTGFKWDLDVEVVTGHAGFIIQMPKED